jgi:uncharacterized protein with PIN domain
MGLSMPPGDGDLARAKPLRGCDRFSCDEMLIRLGRWLRAAGHDTAIARPRGSDRALLEAARADHRVLITRDRKVLEIRDAGASTLLLTGRGLKEWVAETTRYLAIDWLKAPFSRCLLCNRPLDTAPDEAHALLPARVINMAAQATWCPDCEKLYWPGSHVARMRRRLEAWQRREFT